MMDLSKTHSSSQVFDTEDLVLQILEKSDMRVVSRSSCCNKILGKYSKKCRVITFSDSVDEATLDGITDLVRRFPVGHEDGYQEVRLPFSDREMESKMGIFLELVFEKGLEKLEILFQGYSRTKLLTLIAESFGKIRNINTLILTGVQIPPQTSRLQTLHTLILKRVSIDPDLLNKIIKRCPITTSEFELGGHHWGSIHPIDLGQNMENCVLNLDCISNPIIRIGPNLKRFEYGSNTGVKVISNPTPDKLNVMKICNSGICDRDLRDLERFTNLVSLTLTNCYSLMFPTIRFPKVESFRLKGCEKVARVTLKIPNLKIFDLDGNPFHHPIDVLIDQNNSSIAAAEFCSGIQRRCIGRSFFVSLRNIVKLGFFGKIILDKKAMGFLRQGDLSKNNPPIKIKEVKILVGFGLCSGGEQQVSWFFNNLFVVCDPRTLVIEVERVSQAKVLLGILGTVHAVARTTTVEESHACVRVTVAFGSM